MRLHLSHYEGNYSVFSPDVDLDCRFLLGAVTAITEALKGVAEHAGNIMAMIKYFL